MPAAQIAVTVAALAAATICFALYLYATIAAVRARSAALRAGLPPATEAARPRAIGVDEVTALADALGKLADSLSRASPAVTSLIGSLLFLAIAAASSGALRGG